VGRALPAELREPAGREIQESLKGCDGEDAPTVRQVLDEEMTRIRAEVGDAVWEKGRPEETRAVFEKVALSDELPDFLTLPAYEYLD
jgi:hypothetical protein